MPSPKPLRLGISETLMQVHGAVLPVFPVSMRLADFLVAAVSLIDADMRTEDVSL